MRSMTTKTDRRRAVTSTLWALCAAVTLAWPGLVAAAPMRLELRPLTGCSAAAPVPCPAAWRDAGALADLLRRAGLEVTHLHPVDLPSLFVPRVTRILVTDLVSRLHGIGREEDFLAYLGRPPGWPASDDTLAWPAGAVGSAILAGSQGPGGLLGITVADGSRRAIPEPRFRARPPTLAFPGRTDFGRLPTLLPAGGGDGAPPVPERPEPFPPQGPATAPGPAPPPAAVIPLPTSAALLAAALGGLFCLLRRRWRPGPG